MVRYMVQYIVRYMVQYVVQYMVRYVIGPGRGQARQAMTVMCAPPAAHMPMFCTVVIQKGRSVRISLATLGTQLLKVGRPEHLGQATVPGGVGGRPCEGGVKGLQGASMSPGAGGVGGAKRAQARER